MTHILLTSLMMYSLDAANDTYFFDISDDVFFGCC